MLRIELPDGTWSEAEDMGAALMAVETMIADFTRWLRENVEIYEDGEHDPVKSSVAQQAGLGL